MQCRLDHNTALTKTQDFASFSVGLEGVFPGRKVYFSSTISIEAYIYHVVSIAWWWKHTAWAFISLTFNETMKTTLHMKRTWWFEGSVLFLIHINTPHSLRSIYEATVDFPPRQIIWNPPRPTFLSTKEMSYLTLLIWVSTALSCNRYYRVSPLFFPRLIL